MSRGATLDRNNMTHFSNTRTKVLLICFLATVHCSRSRAPSESPSTVATSSPALSPTPTHQGPSEGLAAGLRYVEVVKGKAKPSQALPMVVMIHGMGDSPHADWFISFKEKARIILPQAPKPYGSGYSWFNYRTTEGKLEELAFEIKKVALQLTQAVIEISHKRSTIGKPIVAGFSQGGMLAYALALLHSEKFSYAFPISGFLPESLWPTPKTVRTSVPEILSMHGTEDRVVPYSPDKKLVDHLKSLKYPVVFKAFKGVQHVVTEEMNRVLMNNLEQSVRRLRAQYD